MVSGPNAQVLVFGTAHERSGQVCKLLQKRGLSAQLLGLGPMPNRHALRAADVLVYVLEPHTDAADPECMRLLLGDALAERVVTLVWGESDNYILPETELLNWVSPDVSLDEVIGRLTALARYAPVLKRMERELQRLQRLGHHLNRYFDQVDHELRLAGRLQRDFLPRQLPSLPPMRFAQLYRPAGWVSGDIFDVFVIDRHRIGIFIADAMGHGTSAGLMTLFLRRALTSTRLEGEIERVLTPAEAMCELHEGLARQDLPNTQFVTAAYGIIDVETLTLCLARGGHPYPLHINRDGQIRELYCEGGLLGVAGLEPEFDEQRIHLAAGDKVILYTDGLHELFIAGRDEQTELPRYTERFRQWSQLHAEMLVAAVGDYLDQQEGSLNPEDDMTVVVAEVAD